LGIAVPVGAVGLITAPESALALFAWCLAAVAALAVVHEAGHAAAARLLSLEIHGLHFSAIGACCIADDAASVQHELAYSAAGIIAQSTVLIGTMLSLLHVPSASLSSPGLTVFGAVNLLLIVANCWPRGGTDGHRVIRALSSCSSAGPERAA
jgi:Zn-dependent protease